jgi:hypothetical protein
MMDSQEKAMTGKASTEEILRTALMGTLAAQIKKSIPNVNEKGLYDMTMVAYDAALVMAEGQLKSQEEQDNGD